MNALRTDDERRAFVAAHTARERVPFVPEVELHLATEVTPLWHATQAWLDARELPPPFWAFAWPGGAALARYLLDHPAEVRGKHVLDAASGSGLVAIAAMLAGARAATAIDADPFAMHATAMNAAANGVVVRARAGDACACDLDGVDVVLAGDVFYEQAMASAFGAMLARAAGTGVRALAGDPGRAYAPEARVIAVYEVPVLEDLEGAASKTVRVLSFD